MKVGVPVSGRAAVSAAQPDGVPPAATSAGSALLGAVQFALAGLVAVTPASGFAGPMGSIVLGLIAGLGLSVVPAQARRSATSDPAPAADTVKEPEKAWTTGTVPADCTRSRRKLFQPGEG